MLDMIQSLPLKLIAYLLIIVALGGLYTFHINSVDSGGYNRGWKEALEQQGESRSEQEDKLREELLIATAAFNTAMQDFTGAQNESTRLQGILDARPVVTIYKEIDNVETECTNLGTDYGRVWNNIIGEAPR